MVADQPSKEHRAKNIEHRWEFVLIHEGHEEHEARNREEREGREVKFFSHKSPRFFDYIPIAYSHTVSAPLR